MQLSSGMTLRMIFKQWIEMLFNAFVEICIMTMVLQRLISRSSQLLHKGRKLRETSAGTM